jgi:hypothetical protein
VLQLEAPPEQQPTMTEALLLLLLLLLVQDSGGERGCSWCPLQLLLLKCLLLPGCWSVHCFELQTAAGVAAAAAACCWWQIPSPLQLVQGSLDPGDDTPKCQLSKSAKHKQRQLPYQDTQSHSVI